MEADQSLRNWPYAAYAMAGGFVLSTVAVFSGEVENYVFALVAFGLAAWCLAQRVVIGADGLTLAGPFRRTHVAWAEIDRYDVRYAGFGWRVRVWYGGRRAETFPCLALVNFRFVPATFPGLPGDAPGRIVRIYQGIQRHVESTRRSLRGDAGRQ